MNIVSTITKPKYHYAVVIDIGGNTMAAWGPFPNYDIGELTPGGHIEVTTPMFEPQPTDVATWITTDSFWWSGMKYGPCLNCMRVPAVWEHCLCDDCVREVEGNYAAAVVDSEIGETSW